MIYPRDLAKSLRELAGYYPVVTLTGPRQSGKTTLCRDTYPDKAYVSLEPLDMRRFAAEDPRGFLNQYAAGAIIDEVQHVPELLGYLQVEVDLRPAAGRFILTGSQQFGLTAAMSQTLAGRTGVLHLLPLGLDELRQFEHQPSGLFDHLWQGAYPRIHDRGIPAHRWLADYVTTYVQRDVRQVLNIGDLNAFTIFLKLCAGRTGQEVNLSALGADAGISYNTAKAWLSVLETSYLCFQLQPWHRNPNKRLTKTAKLHFFDTGLVCYLLGIQTPEQLIHHPLRGAIFESWVASEIYKARAHRGLAPNLYHWRQTRGAEVDVVLDAGAWIGLIEAKSGATVPVDAFAPLRDVLRELTGQAGPGRQTARSWVIYGGAEAQVRSDVRVLPWDEVAGEGWD